MTGDRERRIEELLAQRGLRAPAPAGPGGPGGPHGRTEGPLSPGQRRLWLLDRLHPGSAEYNVPMAWRIEGDLDEAALVESVRALCLRHSALRTRITVDAQGEPGQTVLAAAPAVEIVDHGALPDAEREAAVEAAVRAEADGPLDLAGAQPPVRLRLHRHGDRRWTLTLTVHHILFDDWSSGVLQHDLAALYRRATGGGGELAPPSAQYLDWAVRQHERTEGRAEQLAHWRERLEGAPTTVDLPAHPGRESGPGPARQLTVPADPADLARLEELGRAEGCTSVTVLLAAWAALLHRVGGQDDLVIGTPYAQRGPAWTHELIGFFLNTLALRADLTGTPSFRALLGRMRTAVTEAYERAEVPFDEVVEALRPSRSGSRHPLFQVWFAADEVGAAGLDLPGTVCTPLEADGGRAKFDLVLFAARRPAGTELVLEYDSVLFDHATVEQLGRQLARLVRALADAPDRPLSDHELLDPAERELVLRTWNDTAAELGAEPLAHHWFERQAARTPDAIAVEAGDERVSYGELDRRAEAVARALAEAGAGAGGFVGIAVRRSVAMLAAVLGTLRTGAAYVPLDLSHPPERIALLLEDTDPPVVLVAEGTADRLPATGARLIDVGALPAGPVADGPARPTAPADPESVAYVTYTSGSTGRPKGILMPHRAVGNLVAWQLERYRLRQPGHRTLQFASLSFDVSFQEIFSTLGAGGTLVLITEDERRDVHGLVDLLNRHRVQRLFIPAVALQQVAEGYRQGGRLPHTLETVIAGSEQLVVTDDLRRLFADLPNGRLHNEYGPSETHVTTAHHLPADPAEWPGWAPIGRPIANSRVYVLDAARRPVPVGARGEVYIGGAGLAHGYLGRPELTALAFVPDPFSDRPGARLYRTGDIARHLPEGELEFLGRADGQVKIRGFRVELGEVQAGLDAHPAVRSAFVKVDGQGSAERRLIAYVVPQDGSAPGPAELRDFLRRRLPEYMVPAAFVALDRFPLTVNGKVDQRRLPAPEFTTGTGPGAEPRDALERDLAAELAGLLGAERVGRDDDFFQLGGHSLLATKLLWAVQARHHVEFPLADFYRQPTVAGLAELVRGADPASRPDAGAAADEGAAETAAAEQRARQHLDDLFDDLLGPAH
ncbi:amino acid adenylation domain-containing protein [Kitasatospora sp. NPDC086801]|uniref:non-ribosomal peptide synthetase n=1 Tax=Kitasatospora sp. NPDC086801 TaxID=3364066 RepID=UPI0037FF6E55